MRSIIKRTVIVAVIGLVAVQFVPLKKNQDATISDKDITRNYTVPDDVHNILQKACYDCHSNSTIYPWYSKIQPVGWWLNDHVKDGKKHLNFSDFGSYTAKKKAKKLTEVAGTIVEKEMPLGSYTLIHKNAVLTDAEKDKVTGWARTLAQQITDTMKK